MSKLHSKIAIPAAILTIAGGVALATNVPSVSAHMGDDSHTTLMQKLVSRFNLNQSEVEAVFQEVRTERQTEMQAAFEARLTQAVETGRLTEEQKQLVLAKHQEMQEKHQAEQDEWASLTQEGREAKREQRQAELKTWAEENGIDLSWLMPQMGMRGGHERGMGGMMRGEGRGTTQTQATNN